MNHKRAVKKLMGCGYNRNEANCILHIYHKGGFDNQFCVNWERKNYVSRISVTKAWELYCVDSSSTSHNRINYIAINERR